MTTVYQIHELFLFQKAPSLPFPGNNSCMQAKFLLGVNREKGERASHVRET